MMRQKQKEMEKIKFELQNLADEQQVAQEQEKPGLFRRLWNGLKGAAKATKNTILWTEEPEDNAVNPERLSQTVFGNYRKDFTEIYISKTGEKEMQIRFWNQSFSRLCIESRKARKPVIMMVQRDAT